MPVIINGDFLLQRMPGKGGWTYAVLPPVPREFRGHANAVKVSGTLDELEVRSCNLMPMKTGELFLPVNAGLRKQLKKEAGATVKIVFQAEPVVQDAMQDLLTCLEDVPRAYKIFLSCPEKDRAIVAEWIWSAKNEDARNLRIARAIDHFEMALPIAKLLV